jgi:hypothetical protein
MFSFRTILITTCCLFSLNTWAADLYVSTSGSDSNSGSQAAPLRTITKAGSIASAGSTVHVADGTYNENVVTNSSGTASAYITYVSDHKWGAKVVSPNSASGAAAWHNNGDYVTILGFDISGAGAVGINHSGNYDIAKNNHIHNIPAALCDGYGGGGIIFDQYNTKHGGLADSNTIHDIGPLGTNCFHVHGIYPSTDHVTISNNLIYRVVGYAVTSGHCAYNNTIINNTIFANGGTSEGGGIILAGNTNCTNPATGYVVANNIIFDNVLGIHEELQPIGAVYKNNLVFSNITNWGSMGNPHVNDVIANPQFINYSRTGGGDYHLASTSPAIDKGSSTYGPSNDLDGAARPKGAGIDIGAFEFSSASSPVATPTPAPALTPSPTSTPVPAGMPVLSLSAKSLTFASQLIGTI